MECARFEISEGPERTFTCQPEKAEEGALVLEKKTSGEIWRKVQERAFVEDASRNNNGGESVCVQSGSNDRICDAACRVYRTSCGAVRELESRQSKRNQELEQAGQRQGSESAA